jgi:hypothetical protein
MLKTLSAWSFDGLCEHFTYLKLSVVVRDKREDVYHQNWVRPLLRMGIKVFKLDGHAQ